MVLKQAAKSRSQISNFFCLFLGKKLYFMGTAAFFSPHWYKSIYLVYLLRKLELTIWFKTWTHIIQSKITDEWRFYIEEPPLHTAIDY